MIITRERYLDDSSLHHLTLSLFTRTAQMHSALADAPADVQERVGVVLADALTRISGILGPVLQQPGGGATTNFGCGT